MREKHFQVCDSRYSTVVTKTTCYGVATTHLHAKQLKKITNEYNTCED